MTNDQNFLAIKTIPVMLEPLPGVLHPDVPTAVALQPRRAMRIPETVYLHVQVLIICLKYKLELFDTPLSVDYSIQTLVTHTVLKSTYEY